MNEKLTRFYQQLPGRQVQLIGLGRSHSQLLEQLAAQGARVTLRDRRTREQIGQEEATRLESLGVRLLLGEGYLEGLEEADILLRTPGMYFYHPALTQARAAGVRVTSEMELFFDLCPCKIYAVTGSDGKTTTTSIIARMLECQGRRVFLGGNIGFPLLPRIQEMESGDVAVVELSSFQLISMRRSPEVAVVTNLSPNHLDVHRSMEEYIQAKKNIFLHQGGLSRTVLNADNQITAGFAPEVRGELCTFSATQPCARGAFLNPEGILCMAHRHGVQQVLDRRDIRIPGDHNVENYLAAIAAVWGEVSPENIRQVAQEFPGVEHRIEFVRQLDGVRWYNDSIATSPSRVVAGLGCFDSPVVLIAGGYDKQVPFPPMVPKLLEHCRALILLGNTAQKIQEAVEGFPGYDPHRLPILRVKNMEQAVYEAQRQAQPGDVVTLSPACAAFDLYRDFEARGRDFKRLVHLLEGDEQGCAQA